MYFETLFQYQFVGIYIARCTLLIHDLSPSDCAMFWYFALKFHREICVPLVALYRVSRRLRLPPHYATFLFPRETNALKINSRKTRNTADDVALSRGNLMHSRYSVIMLWQRRLDAHNAFLYYIKYEGTKNFFFFLFSFFPFLIIFRATFHCHGSGDRE